MILQRITFNVKVGCLNKLVELINAARAQATKEFRIYTSYIAPLDKLVEEIEFENMAELEKFWADFWANPGTPELMDKFNQLVETGGTNEVWNVVE